MIQAGFYLASMKRGQVGWHVGLWAVLLGGVPTHMAGQLKLSADFHASGCCPWCGENMESALDVQGVKKAHWDQFEQRITVIYRPRKTSLRTLQRLVAEAGHDTDAFEAPDSAYLALPSCCRYRD